MDWVEKEVEEGGWGSRQKHLEEDAWELQQSEQEVEEESVLEFL